MRELDKARVLTVAREAAAKRGFVTYADFNDYLRELMIKKKLQPIEGGRAQWTLKKMLVDAANPVDDRYVYSHTGTKTMFYPAAFVEANPMMKSAASRQAKLE
ncbi:hypothetical protein [Dehalogenimonas sp. 4OHTPN]|uniref:Uncharacterized protein n=1 Tax=Dehalogenimonas sp. 4OHTPN TaxID=3166643 RepID=A0AAU8GCT2_9CHLR